jgi:hypothetical protein
MNVRDARRNGDGGEATPKPTNIENKSLEYDIDIQDVQFNHTGRYFIKMTVQSLYTSNYSKVGVALQYNVIIVIIIIAPPL